MRLKWISTAVATIITWGISSLFLLVFNPTVLDAIGIDPEPSEIIDPFSFLMGFSFLAMVIGMIFSGMVIDYFRRRGIFGLGFWGIALSLGLVPIIGDEVTIYPLYIMLGFSVGILATEALVCFADMVDYTAKAKKYGLIIFLYEITAIIFVIITLSVDWEPMLFGMSAFSAICGILFYYFNREKIDVEDWYEIPTMRIISRLNVIAYFSSHLIVWICVGVAITRLVDAGQTLGLEDPRELFWLCVYLGAGIFCIPAGLISDQIGRRLPAMLSAYGVAIAVLLFGIIENELSFFLSAFILGAAFSIIHVTLDSSVWVDLAPKEARGRYAAIGLVSLALGVGTGYVAGLFVLKEVNIAGFVLIFVSFLAILPLFFVSDTEPPLDLVAFLVIYSDGRRMYSFEFRELQADLDLVGGALIALSSFVSKCIGEEGERGALNLIKQKFPLEDYYVLVEEQKNIIAALLVNKIDIEVIRHLRVVLRRFYQQFQSELDFWDGNRNTFVEADDFVISEFFPLIP